MGWTIEIRDKDYQRLRHHLNSEIEQVAFLFTEPYSDDQRLQIREVRLIPADEFETQSGYHVELADKVRPALIKRAWDEGACLIEAHNHPYGPAGFSPSDLLGFEEWVPHLRWRLKGRPYAALVFTPDDFDALVWDGDSTPSFLEALEIIDDSMLYPTNQTHQKLITKPRQTRKLWWRRLRGH